MIAKVDELTSEQEILREEINSLQTVKTKLQQRVKDLEDDLKKMKEELEKKNNAAKEEGDEDDVPMAQRKRFTRVEMARVLMERNQYKERLMELQEAVRWTEMIRASREHPEISAPKTQKKGTIWNFFSNLFSSSNKPNKKPLPVATVKYNAPTTQVQPVGDPNKRTRSKYNLGDKAKAYEFLQDDLKQIQLTPPLPVINLKLTGYKEKSSNIDTLLDDPVTSQPKLSEKARKEREKERKEQYKQVRAHVKKDDGRLQAYGWSLPAKFQPASLREPSAKSHVPVPVPVYCRPLLEREPLVKFKRGSKVTRESLKEISSSHLCLQRKIWCAAGVNLTGGKTRDGGSIEHEKSMKDIDKDQLSSLVWICHSTSSNSRVSVIDANSPGDVLETFRVSTTPILCIASVAGALESDYPVDEEILKAESYPQYKPPPPTDNNSDQNSGIGGITFVQCVAGTSSPSTSPVGSPKSRELNQDLSAAVEALAAGEEKLDTSVEQKDKYDTESITSERSYEAHFGPVDDNHPAVFKAKGSPVSSGTATPTSSSSSRSLDKIKRDSSDLVRDGLSPLPMDNDLQYEEADKMSSVLPTMWLGSQSGSLYVHSSVAQWKRCLHSVKLRDSILNIVHVKGRVLVALADGTIAIFHRASDGQWDLQNYHLLDLGKPHHSIRCMTVIANKHVWCGYRNKIHVIDPHSMSIASQVRQLAWLGDGVWVSIRLDSTLRLYHAYTHQHLQDVDIEPYVSKMLGNKQTVTTGASSGRPGGIVRVYSDTKTDQITPGSFIPFCSMAQAQLSFHGHRDAVKFFVSVPGSPRKGMSAALVTNDANNKSRYEASPAPPSNTKLVMSGGEGYVDFRIGQYLPGCVLKKKRSLNLCIATWNSFFYPLQSGFVNRNENKMFLFTKNVFHILFFLLKRLSYDLNQLLFDYLNDSSSNKVQINYKWQYKKFVLFYCK
ncbi:hypothetical protein KUTeg_017232 [Tegillarca granosa]|uniref:RH2 domain-containing protein n=1 Tax=Tegillarca granosa TaxID=220873 RepID=A0ABQ9EMV5_TEGGR|nr:hypothetical protein KUTeg_017232 [Tegillarca granosa]